MFLALICNQPHHSPCCSFPSTTQHYPSLKRKQGLLRVVEPNEFPWFERNPVDNSFTCFKYNFKPVQLFSQTVQLLTFPPFTWELKSKPSNTWASWCACRWNMFFLNLKIEISLVEELTVGARVWNLDYSSSASLLNAIKYSGLFWRRLCKSCEGVEGNW